MSEKFCKVAMHEFWALEYGAGDIVLAKITAINERGTSVISASNVMGAQVQTVPF
jgi:hypothetical protein